MSTLMGSEEPRLWTPPLRELTRQTSLGFEVIDFAQQVLAVELYPWQKWLFIHGLELAEGYVVADPNPLFRFDTVIVIVGRQNGKTEAIKVKKLWRIYIDQAETVIATAQDLSNSEKAWAEAVVLAQSTPDLDAEIGKVDLTHGQKSLRLLNGNQYRVAASSRKGGRGWSADDLDLDELREHQSWESWGAVTPTTLARPRSQVWGWSNAGDAASIVLWFLRAQAMAGTDVTKDELEQFTGAIVTAAEDEDIDLGESLALFEWSADPKAGLWDRKGWAQANPAMGHGLLTERKLAGAIRSSPEWVARNEILCQWRSTASGGPFPDGAWEAGVDEQSVIADDSPLGVCVDVSADRSQSHIAVAGWRKDGHLHVEVMASRAGTEWVVPWLTDPERPEWTAVTFQKNGAPVSSLADDLQATDDEDLPILPVVDWMGADLGRASGQIADLVRLPRPDDEADKDKRRVYHLPQPVLDIPATTAAIKSLGDAWVFDRKKSPYDCAPLIAVTGAAWALGRPEDKPKTPQVHAWPDEDTLRGWADGGHS